MVTPTNYDTMSDIYYEAKAAFSVPQPRGLNVERIGPITMALVGQQIEHNREEICEGFSCLGIKIIPNSPRSGFVVYNFTHDVNLENYFSKKKVD